MPINKIFSGLQVSRLSFGTYYTVGNQIKEQDEFNELVRLAYDGGIMSFDSAEAYYAGLADTMLGKALRTSGIRRSDYVLSSKVFFGTGGKGPNSYGLSWKHIVEGTKEIIERVGLPSIDIMYCHSYDFLTPLEEVVRAMNFCIQQGYFYYWGVSHWDKDQIQEAINIADKLGLIPPTVIQCPYNIFTRDPLDTEFVPLYSKCGFFTYNTLLCGLLSGKHPKDGFLKGTRLDLSTDIRNAILSENISHESIEQLAEVAKEVGITLPQLAISYCLKHENITSVVLGVSKKSQLEENLKVVELSEKLTPEVIEKINEIVKPVKKEEPFDARGYARYLAENEIKM